MATFIKRHPVVTYFALAFALSWGGVLLVIGFDGIPGTPEQTETLFPLVYLAMLVGPSVAGILLTALVQGKAGLRAFRSRLLDWRVDARWYAVALLTAPVVTTAVLLALSFISKDFLPGILVSDDKMSLLLFGLGVGLGAGVFEELGWTGFAIPHLKRRHGVLASGLIVGLLWGAWHLLVNIWGAGDSAGSIPLAVFLPVILLSCLPVFRLLMVWVYDRTESLLVAMLMHASLTTSVLVLGPLALSGTALLTYNLALAAALYLVAGAVAMANGWQLSSQPHGTSNVHQLNGRDRRHDDRRRATNPKLRWRDRQASPHRHQSVHRQHQ